MTPYSDEATKLINSKVNVTIFKWVCAPGTMNAKYLPGSCRG